VAKQQFYCPECDKSVSKGGLDDHVHDVHGISLAKAMAQHGLKTWDDLRTPSKARTIAAVFDPPLKIGDEVLYRDGTSRARRYKVIGLPNDTAVVLESQDKRNIEILVKLDEVRVEQRRDYSAQPNQHRGETGSGGRIWLIYVPQGGQPR
jgi:hypothetical protein